MHHLAHHKVIASLLAMLTLGVVSATVRAGELPVLHLRKAATPPALCSRLQNPATSSGWYPSSPTWFGLGGLTGDKNHTEVLATYDSTNLYIAFLNIDRSTVVCKQNTVTNLNTVDSNGIWIQTPAGRKFWFLGSMDNAYPPNAKRASGEFPAYDTKADALKGWISKTWFAGNLTMQQTMIIPWSAMSTTAPTPGSRWQVNFMNYNQTSTNLSNPTIRTAWAPGGATQPAAWGQLGFDDLSFTPPSNITPEATLTLRPASGFGQEVSIRAGNGAADINYKTDMAVTQSDWNDWDPVDYTFKEFMQFDLSMIPADRKIISATLLNYYQNNFESNPTNQYLHIIRVAGPYNPNNVTMQTSPLPVENGACTLVTTSQKGKAIPFDVSDVVAKARSAGLSTVTFALGSSSGDMNNGKAWGMASSRADWYNSGRPRLVITFGSPTMDYATPVNVGSLNYTSVATINSKNKLTNGTFRYGQVEGISNTTYWLDTGYAYINGVNVPFLTLQGDVNPNTGDPALRFLCQQSWKSITQKATGLVGGQSYTFSGWYKGSASGIKADVRLNFKDVNGNSLGSSSKQYSGSGNWEKVTLTAPCPAGTAYCQVDLYNYNSGPGVYMLYSDLQLEQGTKATAYSETMGAYYPDYPRTDGTPY